MDKAVKDFLDARDREDAEESYMPSDGFLTLESERAHLASMAAELDAELKKPRRWSNRQAILANLAHVRARLAEIKPHLKKERRDLYGKDKDQRTRHDIMEDVLEELKKIRAILEAKTGYVAG